MSYLGYLGFGCMPMARVFLFKSDNLKGISHVPSPAGLFSRICIEAGKAKGIILGP